MDQNLPNKNEYKPQTQFDILKNDQAFLREQLSILPSNHTYQNQIYPRTYHYDQINLNDKQMFNLYPDFNILDKGDMFNMCDGQSFVQNIFKGNHYQSAYLNNMNYYPSNMIVFENYNSFYPGEDNVNSNNYLIKDKGIKNEEQLIHKLEIQHKNQKIRINKEDGNFQQKIIQKFKKIYKEHPISSQKTIGGITMQQRRAKIKLYMQKRQRRTYTKKVAYDCRKKVADQRIRVKGRFVTKQQAVQYLNMNQDMQNYSVQEIKKLLNEKFLKKQQEQQKNELAILSRRIKIE